jgi:O-antigen/teichoic acid export membrane protein
MPRLPDNMATSSPPAPKTQKKTQFIVNVLWNWSAVLVNIFSALILSPFVIRRLGDDNFGLWALTVSLAEYYWIMDLGFRSATLKYSAHYRALKQDDRINEILNTALFYSACIGPLLILGTYFGAPYLSSLKNLRNPLFPKLLMIVVGAWVLGSLFNVFSSCLEGFQRFDLTNKIYLVGTAVRAFGTAALLLAGYGVLQMAVMVLIAQSLVHLLSFLAFRRVFPPLRFSRRFVKLPALRTMLSYGAHSIVAQAAQRVLNQGGPLMIGLFLPTRFVGYYAAPSRLLDYVVDGIGRIGNVSNPNAAEMTAQKESHRLVELATITNRYSLALFLPVTIFLGVYGPPLLGVWLGPQFGANCAPVLLALLAGITIAQAGQSNSVSILYGMGRHQRYARALVVEAVITLSAVALVVRPFGIVGVAWVVSSMMLLNRGFFTAWLLSQEIGVAYFRFLWAVYQPLLMATPVIGLLFALRWTILPGRNWPQLILGGIIATVCYFPVALMTLRPDHRELLAAKIRERVSRPAA